MPARRLYCHLTALAGKCATLLTLAAWLGSTTAAQTDVTVLRARVDEPSRAVFFEAPFEVDWQALCRRHLPWAFEPLGNEEVRTIRDRYCEPCGGARVPFRAPAPDDNSRLQAYFVGGKGVHRIEAFDLSVEARFSMRSLKVTPRFDECFGEAVYPVDASAEELDGGFVLMTKGLTVESIRSGVPIKTHADGRTVVVTVESGGRALTASVDDEVAGDSTVLDTELVSAGERQFLFIKWAPDEACAAACCLHRYSIFEVGESLELRASQQYSCDL